MSDGATRCHDEMEKERAREERIKREREHKTAHKLPGTDIPLQTVGTNLVLVQEKEKETTDGGLHIPEPFRKTLPKGRVMVCGPDAKNVKVGDMVYFGYAAAQTVTLNDAVYTVIDENDVALYHRADPTFCGQGKAGDSVDEH